jgi:myo-inositol-1(or 4)-monophosphatase
MMDHELIARRDAAIMLAREAAAMAAGMRASGLAEATMKGAQDFLTVADGATETFLRKRIAELFPQDAIIGEEQGGAPAPDGIVWILDPIDGTSNFARGGDRWCVSVGIAKGGRAVAGAIARHATQEVFAAARGHGATLNGQPIRAAATTDRGRAIIEVGWSMRVPVARFHALAQAVMAGGAGIRLGGSGSLGLVDCAAGRLDGYVELHINSWDACAALAIAREAGCWTSDFDSGAWLAQGNPISFGAPAFGPWLARLLEEAQA